MSLYEEEARVELLLWILIDAFWPRGYLTPNDFHSTAVRYERELGRRGIEISLYPDIVHGHSKAVDKAAIAAMEYGILQPNLGREWVPIVSRVAPFLRRPREGKPILTDEQIPKAREAAEVAFMAFRERRLNDDQTPPAAA